MEGALLRLGSGALRRIVARRDILRQRRGSFHYSREFRSLFVLATLTTLD
jgi:hypothetical protein